MKHNPEDDEKWTYRDTILLGLLITVTVIIIIVVTGTKADAQIAPAYYYDFDQANPLAPTIGAGNIAAGDVSYSIISGGPVGKYMNKTISANTTGMKGSNVTVTNQISVQFLFKPGRDFQSRIYGASGGIVPVIQAGPIQIDFQYPYVVLSSTHVSGGFDMDYITLEGVNKASWKNLQDGGWHMITVTLNGATGSLNKRLYIDGQSPGQFIANAPAGTLDNSNPGIWLVKNGNLNRMYAGDIDEVAVYNGILTTNQVWKNYQDFQNGVHYTTALAATVPAYDATTASFDPLEYPVGYTAGTDATATPIQQMIACPKPRAKPIEIATDSLPNVTDAADWYYGGQALQPGISANQAVLNGVEMNFYWAKWYNGSLSFNQIGNQDPADTTTMAGKIVKIRNANRQLKLSGSTYLAQQNDQNVPFDAFNYCTGGEFPLHYSLQNSAGRHINEVGTVCPNWAPPFPYVVNVNESCGCGLGRQARPTRPSNQGAGFPWNNLAVPGAAINANILNIDAALTGTQKIDYLWENREVFKLATDAAIAMDPVVEADRIASGLSARDYQSQFVAGCEGVFYNSFMGTCDATTGTLLQGYQNQDQPGYFFNFQYTKLNYPKYRNKYLSSTDDYPRLPSRWFQGVSADHGLIWHRNTLNSQFAGGDSLKIDFVSAGWDKVEYNNVSPVQWLGYLKFLGAWGNVSFITSIFSNIGGQPIPVPGNYTGTVYIVPSYAYAILTRQERFLHNGLLLPGDLLNDPQNTTDPAYEFNTGDFRARCAIRQQGSINRYAITTMLSRNANMVGNTEDSVVRSVVLNGETLTMTIKEQGSVYIYDRTDITNKVFYQLDKWHEDKHPTRWSTDFNFEAEVNDNFDSDPVSLKTYQRAGAPAGDYVNSTTVVSYPTSGALIDSILFNFVPSVTGTYYTWIRLRSKTGAATDLKFRLNTGTVYTLPVSSTTWYWYRFDNGVVAGPGINYSLTLDQMNHLAIIAGSNDLEIDQIVFTKTPNAGYPEAPVTGCIPPPTSTITPTGSLTFCTGGSVLLTATLASSYLWSTGATTQAITATLAGNYVVTITDGSGCTGVSATSVVVVSAIPTKPTIAVTGSLTFCTGGSVLLTSSAIGSGIYLWSTGATTQAITATLAGAYRVTVTNAAGCTRSSNTKTVVVNALPGVPVITPSGATTFCQGATVDLSATASTGYLWSNGVTTQVATINSAGTYTVTVTNASGCTNASAGTVVTVDPNPIIASVAPQVNACPAVTFDLATIVLVNTGEPGVTSYHAIQADAIAGINPIATVIGVSGTYWLRVTSGAGCFDVVSVSVTITPCACATPTISNASVDQAICAGATATLAGAIGGSATVGTWTSSGTGAFTPSAVTLNAVYTPSVADIAAGSVTLTLTTDNPLGAPCVPAVDDMLLTINAALTATITAGGPTSICVGSTVTLGCNSGASYLWSNGETTQTIIVSTAASYSCTLTDLNGCTDQSNAINVFVNALPGTPIVSASGSTTICSGGSVTLTAPSFTSYLWSTGATTQSIVVSTDGDYSVTVTNAGGCTGVSAITTVFVTTTIIAPVITPGPLVSICPGATVVLSSSTASAYLWSNGVTIQTITVGTTGTYTVTITEGGCTASASVSVNVRIAPAKPVITPSGTVTACLPYQSVDLVSTPYAGYLWNTGATTQNIITGVSGTYRVTITDGAGCTRSSDPVTLVVGSSLTASITATPGTSICSGSTASLMAAAATSYLWSNGATTRTAIVSNAGTYTVTITDAYSCTKTASVTIKVKSIPTAAITPSGSLTFCVNGSVRLSAPDGTGYTWLWSNGATNRVLTIKNSGTFTVTVTNSLGCTKSSVSVTTVKNTACTTACAVPVGINAINIKKTKNPQTGKWVHEAEITWADANFNDSYRVFIKKFQVAGSTVYKDCTVDKRSVVFFDLKPGTKYQYWMKGWCNGVPTDTTAVKTFITLSQ